MPSADGLHPWREKSSAPWLPLAWCNLRRNPFGELTRDERADLAVFDVDDLTRRVQTDHSAVQLIGDCGRGKTTRMLALLKSLPDASYAYLPEAQPCPSIAAASVVLIDEAQRLPRRVRKRVFATGLPLILATHRDLTRPLCRAGYTVYTEQIGLSDDPDLVYRALNRRIQASRLDADRAIPELSMIDARQLVTRFGTDLRAMESYLYDVVQSQAILPSQAFSSKKTPYVKMRFID